MPYKTASLTTAAVHSRLESPAPRIQNFKFVHGNRVRVCVSCVRAGWPAGPLFRALDIAQKLISSERKLSHYVITPKSPLLHNKLQKYKMGSIYGLLPLLLLLCRLHDGGSKFVSPTRHTDLSSTIIIVEDAKGKVPCLWVIPPGAKLSAEFRSAY